MPVFTDQHAELLTSLPDDDEAAAQVIADAARVYRYVRRNEMISEAALRAYGERNDLPPDRMNATLAFLAETKRLHVLPDLPAAAVVLPAPPADDDVAL